MKEEKSEKEIKVKKKISKIIGTITVACVLMITAGCGITGKGSRSWLENEVSDIEKVYPTENPEDLFEKFPIGFRIEQLKAFEKDGKNYSVEIVMRGNPVLEKPELEDSLLFKKYFLFQKLKLNKDILKKLEVKDKSFSFETYRYNIKYLFTNKEIDDYLGLDKGKVSLDIRGRYSERDKTYFHSVVITEDRKELYFGEKIVEEEIGRGK